MRKRLFYSLLVFPVCFLTIHSSAKASTDAPKPTPQVERVKNAVEVCQEFIGLPEEGIPEALLHKSQAIAIMPGVFKAAYVVGGEHGNGVLLVRRDDGSWSNPIFISMTGGSLGFQIGAQKADIILVFKDRKSVETITRGKFTLGGDASVAVGPVGRAAEASTDIKFEAEVYSYSKAKGLFAGVSIKGASISIDKDSNASFYRSFDLTADDILNRPDLEAPQVARELRNLLAKYAK
jgi:lipid-binding SYLF domain-containing protein